MAHKIYVLEVHRKNAPATAKPDIYGAGFGGVPFITPKMVAEHFAEHGTFNRFAKKVVVKRHGDVMKTTASNIHRLKDDDIPDVVVDKAAEEEADEAATHHLQPNLAEGAAVLSAPPDLQTSKAISKALGGSGKSMAEERGAK